MSIAIGKALIVGGGFSGMSAAIQLRKVGVDVDLVEIDPGWRSYGAGITVGGAALTVSGAGAISVAELRAANEAWLPGYMQS